MGPAWSSISHEGFAVRLQYVEAADAVKGSPDGRRKGVSKTGKSFFDPFPVCFYRVQAIPRLNLQDSAFRNAGLRS